MGQSILIVEDQFLIAIALEDAILASGHYVAGIAASMRDVERIQEDADIALVDVNLLDGPTGPEIGRALAARGCEVVFMTANPEVVADGVLGTIGVMCKPVMDGDLINVIQYAKSRRSGDQAPAPANLKLFAPIG